jgi:hypothetical protein
MKIFHKSAGQGWHRTVWIDDPVQDSYGFLFQTCARCGRTRILDLMFFG